MLEISSVLKLKYSFVSQVNIIDNCHVLKIIFPLILHTFSLWVLTHKISLVCKPTVW